MLPLPFAPRPQQGEALASWVARLAAYNFVSIEAFWDWLGFEADSDLAPPMVMLHRLEGATQIPVRTLARRFKLGMGNLTAVVRSKPTGIRGGACPRCCYLNQAWGQSHFAHQVAASIFRVTCPIHRLRLVSLDGYRVEFDGDVTRFTKGARVSLGDQDRWPNQPDPLALKMEGALERAGRGKAPGIGWRTNDPLVFMACINCLADVVFWQNFKGTFASTFDDVMGGFGTNLFFISPGQEVEGMQVLAGLTPPARLNAVKAFAALMEDSSQPRSKRLRDNARRGLDHEDAFATLVNLLQSWQLALLKRRSVSWPQCIASPLHRAFARLSSAP